MKVITRPRKRHLELDHYHRIIECTTRQIAHSYGLGEAIEALRKSGEIVRKEILKQMETRP